MTANILELQPNIFVLPNARELGQFAAAHVAEELRRRLAAQANVRMIFAAAPSQAEMLHALAGAPDIDWARVEAFHMDEYVGLCAEAPQRFGQWLRANFFDRVSIGTVNLLDPGVDCEREAERYARLLKEEPVDIVCLGIGMNGHIAFNDPPADFGEARDVRVVELDLASREQQVREKLFPAIAHVPTHALTLSIPCMMRAEKLYCCVPGTLKTAAVTRAFTGTIDPDLPASILREHPACTVYLDTESAAGLLAARS